MVKIYGDSDNTVVIDGLSYKKAIECYNKNVIIEFKDGTVVKVSYLKDDKAIWSIDFIESGPAYKNLRVCNNENAEIYSDVFIIDSEIVKYDVVDKVQPNKAKATLNIKKIGSNKFLVKDKLFYASSINPGEIKIEDTNGGVRINISNRNGEIQ